MNIEELRKALIRDEGLRLAAYLDPEGILTVGIGHNCIASPVAGVTKPGDRITEELAYQLFDADIGETIKQLDRTLPWWRGLDSPRQNVLLNMGFNMGVPKLSKFVKTLQAIQREDYEAAADEMLESRWAAQVGNRALRLAQAMEEGTFV
mgnify:CR=1 FL=1